MIRIKALEIMGFKSIRQATIDLSAVNVLIGANGAGKSNLLSLFRLLNYAMSGGLQLFVQRQGGASKILHHGPKHTPELSVRIDFETDSGINSYLARWEYSAGDRLVFAEEEISYLKHGEAAPYRSSLGRGHSESALLEQNDDQTARFIKGTLDRFRVYHFHDTSAGAHIKQMSRVVDNRYLRHDGGNLAPYLYRLQQTHPHVYRKICRTIQNVAPFFQGFALQPEPVNQTHMALVWQERGSDLYFDASDLSDGTLRFMCLATLLLQPEPPRVVILDEPELGLHPAAIHVLVALLRSAAIETQFILSTQSVTFVDEIEHPADVIVVEREPGERGQTNFHRLSEERLRAWLTEYSLGQIWCKNLAGGRP